MTASPPIADPVTRPSSRSGLLIMAAAISVFAAMDLLTKLASAHLPIVEIIWGRYVVTLLALIAWAGPVGFLLKLRCRRPKAHLLRAGLLLTANVSFMLSLPFLPLTAANVIGFAAPLLMIALTYPVLGERVSRGHWIAVIIGFVGVLVVMRPGAAIFQWAALLPLLMAFAAAGYHVLTPWIARTEDPAITLFFVALIGTTLFSAVVPWVWSTPRPQDWLMLVAIGLCGTIGTLLAIKAFTLASTAALAPIFYLHLIWSLVFDVTVFGTRPDAFTIAGAVLVVASGLYVYRAR